MEESVNPTSINSKKENFINDNYGDIFLSDKSTDEHINSDDPNKTASDNEITINSIEHQLSDSITSVGNLDVKSCSSITRLESFKNEFNLKAMNSKRNLVLKIENLKDEITSIQKGVEPTFDQNLVETINQYEDGNGKLNDKIKLLDTTTKQKLTDFLLQQNIVLITHQGRLTTLQPAKIVAKAKANM